MRKIIYIFLITLLQSTIGNCFAQSQKIDSLTNLINVAPEDSNKVNLLYNLGRQYSLYSSNENINQFIIGLQLSKKIKFKNGIKKISPALINYLFYKDIYDVSMSFCLDYIDFLEKENLSDDKFKIYNVLANLYSKQGNDSKAFFYYNLAKNYFFNNNEMLKYANVLNNVSILFVKKNELDSALFYSLRALKIYNENNNKAYIANSLLGIGEIHLKKNDLTNGKIKVIESLNLYTLIDEKHGICNCNFVLGQFCFLSKQYDSALYYFSTALTISETLKITFIKKDCYQNISKTYYTLHKYKEAYNFNLFYTNCKDSIAIEKTKAKMMEMEVKYDITRKETKLNEQEFELQSKNKQRNYLSIIIAIIFILFFISYNAYSQKKKANAAILEQKKIVDKKQEEILSSIRYAKRIQQALLPTQKYIERKLNALKK